MRLWIRTARIIFIVLAFLWTAPYLFLFMFGKAIFRRQFEELTGCAVRVGLVDVGHSLNFLIEKISFENAGAIASISITPDIISCLRGRLVFSEVHIEKPNFTFVRRPKETPPVAHAAESGAVPRFLAVRPLFPNVIKRLIVSNGAVTVIDYRVKPEGLVLRAANIYLAATDFATSLSSITGFELRGDIPWAEGPLAGRLSASGWMNLFKKDMQAHVDIRNIDGLYLASYYAKNIPFEKTGIEKAVLNLATDIVGVNNELTLKCRLELTDIIQRRPTIEEPRHAGERYADAVLERFREKDLNAYVLEFSQTTKMDQPDIGFGIIRTAVEDKLARSRVGGLFKPEAVFLFPGRLAFGVIKGVGDVSRALVEGGVVVGTEVKRALHASFDRGGKSIKK